MEVEPRRWLRISNILEEKEREREILDHILFLIDATRSKR